MCHPLAKQKCQPSRSDRSGRPSNDRIQAGIRDYALALISENYADFGPTLAAEMLAQHHALMVSRETLRNWMIGSGLWDVPHADRQYPGGRRHRSPLSDHLRQNTLCDAYRACSSSPSPSLHAPGVHR